jgi:NADP-dependent 3-hydroxy acid dehydrogenase YdfG
VLATARDTVTLNKVVAADVTGRIEANALDVRDTEAVRVLIRQLVERVGRLHVLVNCAGISRLDPVLELAEADWHDVLQTNLTGAFVAAQQAARHMAEHGGGAIINVASVDAFIADSPAVHYCVSKAHDWRAACLFQRNLAWNRLPTPASPRSPTRRMLVSPPLQLLDGDQPAPSGVDEADIREDVPLQMVAADAER